LELHCFFPNFFLKKPNYFTLNPNLKIVESCRNSGNPEILWKFWESGNSWNPEILGIRKFLESGNSWNPFILGIDKFLESRNSQSKELKNKKEFQKEIQIGLRF
jgi:hypothetical protein